MAKIENTSNYFVDTEFEKGSIYGVFLIRVDITIMNS